MSQKKWPNPLNRVLNFLLKMGLYGYQKSVILWRFQTTRHNLVTKCTRKKIFTKNWTFHEKMAKSKNMRFLSTTLFRRYFQNLCMFFGISTELRILFYPWSPILSKKMFDSIKRFCHFLKTKFTITMRNLKIEKRA